MNWVKFQERNFDFGKIKLHEIDAFTFRKNEKRQQHGL